MVLLSVVVLCICVFVASATTTTETQQTENVASSTGFTPCLEVGACSSQSTEMESWRCVGANVFRPLQPDEVLTQKYVVHDCGGVGWGNSIRGVANSFSLAAVMNRPLIVKYSAMADLWMPPSGHEKWDYGFDEAWRKNSEHQDNPHESGYSEYWEFEKFGRPPHRWANFVSNLSSSHEVAGRYVRPVLIAGVCGGEREMFVEGDCLTRALPAFGKCIYESEGQRTVNAVLLLAPVFNILFAKPSSLMVNKLNMIRNRLRLPAAPATEPMPGGWGLQTDGYYILAMHFRRVPLGFEPLSAELNSDRNLEWRLSVLDAFWHNGKKIARQARDIAQCRGQKLLIYFATDNARDLRPEAITNFGQYGQVIFGLKESEVGHVSPQWHGNSWDTVKETALMLHQKGQLGFGSRRRHRRSQQSLMRITGDAEDGVGSAEDFVFNGEDLDAEYDAADAETLLTEFKQQEIDDELESRAAELLQPLVPVRDDLVDVADLLVDIGKSEDQVRTHGAMALVEWWILANANWLVSHSGTSFSDTAAGWGLGPSGPMERLDVIHTMNHVETAFRKDWTGNVCQDIGAISPDIASKCPNIRLKQ